MHQDAQTHFAFLVGRDVAAEKALLTLLGNRSGNLVSIQTALQTNFSMGKGQIPKRLQEAGLAPNLLRTAEDGFHKLATAVLTGLANNKYLPPPV